MFEIAAKNAKSEKKRASYIVNGANALHKNGDNQECFKHITSELPKITDYEAKAVLYEGLAELYDDEGNRELEVLALEKTIEYRPNHTTSIFNTAYSHSKNRYNDLALLHYIALLRFSPNHKNGINNLGVAYSELEMPAMSVTQFKKASELGNTLASANLANAYLDAGFVQEASDVIKTAREQENPHRNVGSSFSAIADKQDAEEKLKQKTIENARLKQNFLRAYADAFFISQERDVNLNGIWNSDEWANVKIIHTKEKLEAEWMKKEKPQKFIGKVENRAASIDTYSQTYSFITNEKQMSKDNTGKLYYSIEEQKIFVLIEDSKKAKFITLEKTGELPEKKPAD